VIQNSTSKSDKDEQKSVVIRIGTLTDFNRFDLALRHEDRRA
jgi:hypothetical protein